MPARAALLQLYAMVECMDRGTGQVQEELRSLQVEGNTILVFASDNGPFLSDPLDRYNGPFRGAKGDALEGGIRVPGIIRWPDGLPAETQVHTMTHFCDWLPTLTSLAGCRSSTTPAWDGYDLSPLLRSESGSVPQIRFWQRNRYEPLPRCNGAMRDGPWKLVWPMRAGADNKAKEDNLPYIEGLTTAHRLMSIRQELPPRPAIGPVADPQLFHVENDPHEDRDLARDHPQRVSSMTKTWDAWFDEVTAAWPRVFRDNIAVRDNTAVHGNTAVHDSIALHQDCRNARIVRVEMERGKTER